LLFTYNEIIIYLSTETLRYIQKSL
jgi:hypothetical protein